MKKEKHLERLRESVEVIDESITKGYTKRQRTIGFSCSAAAVDMLEILLHSNNLIDPGALMKHEWFASKAKVREKLPFEFPDKEKILALMFAVEGRRNDFCYGAPKEEKEIGDLILKFNELKELFRKNGVEIEK